MNILSGYSLFTLLCLFGLLVLPAQSQVDHYGGWTDVKAKGRGYFSLSEINGRHTFVTPDGHAYYAMGINHLNSCRNERYSHLQDFQTDQAVLKRIKDDLGYIERTTALIRQQCQRYKENRFLIGYYWTDTPRWDVVTSRRRHLKDWVSYLRNLGPEAAGKQAYVAFLKKNTRASKPLIRPTDWDVNLLKPCSMAASTILIFINRWWCRTTRSFWG